MYEYTQSAYKRASPKKFKMGFGAVFSLEISYFFQMI